MSKPDVLPYLENAYSFLMDPAIGVAIKEIKHLRQQNAELLEALHTIGFVDAPIVVPDSMWDTITPKEGFEAGFLGGAMAVRDAVKTKAYSVIAKATEGEK